MDEWQTSCIYLAPQLVNEKSAECLLYKSQESKNPSSLEDYNSGRETKLKQQTHATTFRLYHLKSHLTFGVTITEWNGYSGKLVQWMSNEGSQIGEELLSSNLKNKVLEVLLHNNVNIVNVTELHI